MSTNASSRVSADTALTRAHAALSAMLLEQGAPVCTSMLAERSPMPEIVGEAIKADVVACGHIDGATAATVERWVDDLVAGLSRRVLAAAGAMERDGCLGCADRAFMVADADERCSEHADPLVLVDLIAGDEPDPDAEHGVEVEILPLIAHPRADRRALVAAEVRVMLRDLDGAAMVAGIGGSTETMARLCRARDEAVRLLDAGRVGDAHSVATQALYPVGASVGVASVGQVRS